MNEVNESEQYLKEAYQKARENFPNLPPLEDLTKEFDLVEATTRQRLFPRNILKHIRWHLVEVLNGWAGYLQGFLSPHQQSAIAMEEYSYFTDAEKEDLVKIINWIMYRARASHALQLDDTNEKSATFIAETCTEWKEWKPRLHQVISKNADMWKKKL